MEERHKDQKMDHSTSFRKPLSILRTCCSYNCTRRISDMDSQIIPPCERTIKGITRDSIIVAENNNYLTSAIETCGGSSDPQLFRWSSNVNWTRKSSPVISQDEKRRKWLCFGLSLLLAILIIVIGILLVTNYLQHTVRSGNRVSLDPINLTTPSRTIIDLADEVTEVTTRIAKPQINSRKTISKQAWFALQKNDARHSESSEESPGQIFSVSKDKVHRIPCGGESSRTPCCKLEKSTEILEFPGCAPIEVPKHQCLGGCDYVFVEGNPYVSIPTCQPVRMRKLKFKLNCGHEVKRIAIEVASRCRCA